MSRKTNKDDDLDLTRIEDLPRLDHPPLPQLPAEDPPNFEVPNLPAEEFEAIDVTAQEATSGPDSGPAQEMALDELPEFDFESTAVAEINERPEVTSTNIEIKKSITEELFQDVKADLETFVLKHVPFESYPSYSLYISNIVNGQQRNGIKLLLKEYQLLQSDAEKQLVNRSMQLKHLLIPRISEYAAVYFANKLENYHLKIKLSPSEDLTGHHESWDLGPITQESFNHHKEMEGIVHPEIFMSQAFSIADKRVLLIGEVLQQTFSIPEREVENITHYFKDLVELKEKARNINANAIVGLNFQQLQNHDPNTLLYLVTGEAARVQDE